MSRGDYPSRAEVEELLAAHFEDFLKVVLRMLAPEGSDALRAARQRAAETEEHDPAFASQVAAVAKARRDGAHVSLGVDAGHRQGAGLVKLSGDNDADAEVGPKFREIRARARRRQRREGRGE